MLSLVLMYVNSKDLDQHDHLLSLFKAFPDCINHVLNVRNLQAQNEGSGHTAQMCRLIWTLADPIKVKHHFSVLWRRYFFIRPYANSWHSCDIITLQQYWCNVISKIDGYLRV